jgi:hypothetical protein
MNNKYQRIRANAQKRALARRRRKETSQRDFEAGRLEHIKLKLRESIVKEQTQGSFDKGSWGSDIEQNIPDVLKEEKKKGFDKESFNDGGRE